MVVKVFCDPLCPTFTHYTTLRPPCCQQKIDLHRFSLPLDKENPVTPSVQKTYINVDTHHMLTPYTMVIRPGSTIWRRKRRKSAGRRQSPHREAVIQSFVEKNARGLAMTGIYGPCTARQAGLPAPSGLLSHDRPGWAYLPSRSSLDRWVAVSTALISMLRNPRISRSCTAAMVVPPGVRTWSRSTAGCLPVS